MKQKILFVCLGNICRSPAANGILEHLAKEAGLESSFKVDSAGTYGGHAGQLPDGRMREAALKRGYSLTHRSRKISEDDFELFDRIIAMDDSNYENLRRMAPSPEAVAKIERFASLCRTIKDVYYVPDPYYEGREGFEKVLDILENGCQSIIDACR